MTQKNRYEPVQWKEPNRYNEPDMLPLNDSVILNRAVENLRVPYRHSLPRPLSERHRIRFKMWNYWLKSVILCLFDFTNGSIIPRHLEPFIFTYTVTHTTNTIGRADIILYDILITYCCSQCLLCVSFVKFNIIIIIISFYFILFYFV